MAARKPPKAKKCRQCPTRFTPKNSLQTTCGVLCAVAEVREKRAKRERKQQREERRQRRRRLEELKTKPALTREAQAQFNKFIRLRDEGKPCISCGELNPPERHGGAWDCGHYRSVAAAPELRFDERNAYRQCKGCNGGRSNFTRKAETVRTEYRRRLIARVGLATVEWLEGPHDPKHYTHDELRAIRDDYRARVREMRRAA